MMRPYLVTFWCPDAGHETDTLEDRGRYFHGTYNVETFSRAVVEAMRELHDLVEGSRVVAIEEDLSV